MLNVYEAFEEVFFFFLLTGLSLFLFCMNCCLQAGYVLARRGSLGMFLALLRQRELKSSSRGREREIKDFLGGGDDPPKMQLA